MSEARIPFAVGDLKRVGDRVQEHVDLVNAALGPHATVNFSVEVIPGPAAHPPPPQRPQSQPRRQRPDADPDTYTPIEHILYSVQTFGFTHPSHGRYLMMPKEFQAILLLETKAVAAVVWEIMQQSIGWEGDGPGGRREWVLLTKRHFVRESILSRSQVERGFKRALAMGYISRRQKGPRRFEYAIRWKGTN